MPNRSEKASEVSVKSSMRTLEILEYCDSVQRPVTISELVSQLGYPQSSTSVLIQSLVNAGYLAHGADGRSVVPTSRVAQLGSWIDQPINRPDIKRLMTSLGEATGLTIVLGVPHSIFVRYIDVVPGRLAMRLDIPVSTRLPLVASGMGQLLLSCMSDAEIARVHAKVLSLLKNQGREAVRASDIADLWNDNPQPPTLEALMASIRLTRARGYSLSNETVTMGAGIVSVPMPVGPLEPPLGLGVAGLSARIQGSLDSLLDALEQECGKLQIPLKLRREPSGS
jgi:DNA-binding IclR family transcriptional regulator